PRRGRGGAAATWYLRCSGVPAVVSARLDRRTAGSRCCGTPGDADAVVPARPAGGVPDLLRAGLPVVWRAVRCDRVDGQRGAGDAVGDDAGDDADGGGLLRRVRIDRRSQRQGVGGAVARAVLLTDGDAGQVVDVDGADNGTAAVAGPAGRGAPWLSLGRRPD